MINIYLKSVQDGKKENQNRPIQVIAMPAQQTQPYALLSCPTLYFICFANVFCGQINGGGDEDQASLPITITFPLYEAIKIVCCTDTVQ